ncbi:(Na+)-NQR maturation NqrM [Alcanivorax quisquiliarum]|uniref:(Na+)-NQR maturation NqrM n=1 Tax=Alcanivorax quisquiliarum TaxID=2933565 RepID=A0ABT0E3W0_9GAMM|nr:(Na+)-NQR maturation NqrM [Alcanivorax quisquiliarum]MCK0536499.1 (Na+)-NQR maturation NqrM [Alcanivorax quisquiliarum]
MLMTYVAASALLLLLFAGMAIGVILGNKPMKGSCGGMSAMGLTEECDLCGRNPADCENAEIPAEQAQRAAALSRDANRRA